MRNVVCAAVFSAAVTVCAQTAAEETEPAKAFRAECGAKAEAADEAGSIVVEGKDGWLFLTRELRHVSVGTFWGEEAAKVSRAARPDRADPLPAILDFHQQLQGLGIELIIVPVPPKAFVYPDKISDKVAVGEKEPPPRLDDAHRQFYKLLSDNGVTIIDLMAELLPLRAQSRDEDGKLYCRQDTHWSGRTCVLTAQLIAKQLKSRPWYDAVAKQDLACEERSVQINGDLRRSLEGSKPPRESLPLRFVGTKDGDRLAPVEPDRGSPVILLGDSHALVFHAGGDMHTTGAGLADQLAFELSFAVDLIGVRGSGATPARVSLYRRGRRDENYFDAKKAVVWCFSAREFTESTGWSKVPVKR